MADHISKRKDGDRPRFAGALVFGRVLAGVGALFILAAVLVAMLEEIDAAIAGRPQVETGAINFATRGTLALVVGMALMKYSRGQSTDWC